MEIALLHTNSIKVKGKLGSFVVNPNGKVTGINGIINLTNTPLDKTKIEEGVVILKGPGEYEVAGVKISGMRNSTETVYTLTVDNVSVLVGRGEVIAKDHQKLREHNIVVILADTVVDSSFITALAPNVVLFYGDKAEESIKQLAKEGYKKEVKYQTTADKLPQEMEEVLLQQ